MPIHNWLCDDCDYKTEKLGMPGDRTPLCRKCGKEMHKIPTQASFILKGPGWAKDNYAGKEE